MPKKKYQVIKATTRKIPGLYVGGRKKTFGKNGTFETDDEGEAAEINKVLGAKGTGEVVVTSYKEKEHGHTYTFGASRSFSTAWDEMMERRNAKKKKQARKRAEVKREKR